MAQLLMKHTYTNAANITFTYEVFAEEKRVEIEVPIFDAQLMIRFCQFLQRETGAKVIGYIDDVRHPAPWKMSIVVRDCLFDVEVLALPVGLDLESRFEVMLR